METTVLIGEFLKVVTGVLSLIPTFEEKKKVLLEKETNKLLEIEKAFQDAAVSFDLNSYADELLGLADQLTSQSKKVKTLITIYSKELQA
jgi:hypothetical protein